MIWIQILFIEALNKQAGKPESVKAQYQAAAAEKRKLLASITGLLLYKTFHIFLIIGNIELTINIRRFAKRWRERTLKYERNH